MKLPIIEYAVTLGGAPLAFATTEEQAVRFLQLIEEAATPGVALTGALGVQTIKREVEVATVADVDARTLDTKALAAAYDELQIVKAAAVEPVEEVVP